MINTIHSYTKNKSNKIILRRFRSHFLIFEQQPEHKGHIRCCDNLT